MSTLRRILRRKPVEPHEEADRVREREVQEALDLAKQTAKERQDAIDEYRRIRRLDLILDVQRTGRTRRP